MKNLKFRKKWTTLILSLALVLSLLLMGGCGKQSAPANGPGQSQTAISSAQEESSAEQEDQDGEQQGADADDSENGGSDDGTSQPDDSSNGSEDGQGSSSAENTEIDSPEDEPEIAEDGSYTTKEDVALYLYTYGHLPENFITKKEAKKLGWSGGSLEEYAPGKCIGGDYFGNYEGNLPEKKGREYHECDIDTLGAKKRGAKRIIYSNDGLIYYTADHYESFELLYGEE